MNASSLMAALLLELGDAEELEINSLPLEICALLAKLAPPVGGAAVWKRQAAKRLESALVPRTIGDLSLPELAAALDGLRACSPEKVDGKMVAHFAARLIAAEITVGGPYRNAVGQVEVVCNAWVSQCVRWLAEPLPHVEAYLRSVLPEINSVDPDDIALWAMLHTYPGHWLEVYAPLINRLLALHVFNDSFYYRHHPENRKGTQRLARQVYDYSRRGLPSVPEPLNSNTRRMLEQVIVADNNQEISQIARYFGDALTMAAPGRQDLYLQLGAANLYAWTAYTIYDDFLDGEGRPALLATANFNMRMMLRHYRLAMRGQPQYQQFVEAALTMVDQANALEASKFRFNAGAGMLFVRSLPDYGDLAMLADRALFHILGPMAVLCASGQAKVGDASWLGTLQAFRHYLIARQLNDDIHDWVIDLQAGQASYVVVELLRYLNVQAGSYRIDELLPYAKRQFWQSVLPYVCEVGLQHVYKARQCLQQSLGLRGTNKLLDLFGYTEQSLCAAKTKRSDGQLLLRMLCQSV